MAPFSLPAGHGAQQVQFCGPYATCGNHTPSRNGPLNDFASVWKFDFEDIRQSSLLLTVPLETLALSITGVSEKISQAVSANGMLGIFMRSAASMTKWHLLMWDTARQFDLAAMVDSAITVTLPSSDTLTTMFLDGRRAYINASKWGAIIDYRARKVEVVFTHSLTSTMLAPLDSTCFAMGSRTGCWLVDLGLSYAPTVPRPKSFSSGNPCFAVLSLDTTPIVKEGLSMHSYAQGSVSQIAAYLQNPKATVDGVALDADPWEVIYVIHTNYKVTKTKYFKTREEFSSVLSRLQSSPFSVAAQFVAMTQTDAEAQVARTPAEPMTLKERLGWGHSRSGVRSAPAQPLFSPTGNFAVAVKISSTKEEGMPTIFQPCQLSASEAWSAFKALKLI